ncbi:probable glycosyltransferase STELLO1 [Haliotis rubra]|uniref:probable glycosyltransferase STELLO1 n=1 Tax=Haliotis rubra TaxID=36100 RepID=UPI001EE5800D|nr:probable glycosyltransferase STELLO1 [Haliotis rubra]
MQVKSAHVFRILNIVCMCFVLVYVFWFSFSPRTNTAVRYPKPNPRVINKFRTVRSDRWIVVTTISYPTPDIKFLAKIPGWKVVVVGDTTTPKDWRYPNCTFLSLDDQHGLGFETTPHLPERSYSRKTVGYLFAIAHGAKVIYETDDDNRPLDLLKHFVLDPTMWGLLYKGENLFNPYRHFGQPTLWPRGYPLGSVGENITQEYELSHWKTPSIQQGIVNGDPDMDAIFRLTRKQTHSQLNVTFDDRAPPAIVPAGVFSPFNSQNTLFLYDALWALLIPTTTTFRVCDIWRGYWAQRLLWEMGGNLGFFPPNAFQKRNSHSYLSDAKDEKYLYFLTERLVDFLSKWRCSLNKTFFDCMVELSTAMVQENFWRERDARLTYLWIKDLKALGYKEPKRIPFGLLKEVVDVSFKHYPLAVKETGDRLRYPCEQPRGQTNSKREDTPLIVSALEDKPKELAMSREDRDVQVRILEIQTDHEVSRLDNGLEECHRFHAKMGRRLQKPLVENLHVEN